MKNEPRTRAPLRRAGGALTVELALCMFIFLAMMLGTMEVARALFVVNTVQEVTRQAARAAAVTDFSLAENIAALKRRALFRDNDGPLVLMPNLGPAQLRIEYLRANGDVIPVASMPSCPLVNLRNCTQDPSGQSCIRFVRARICAEADGACTRLPLQTMTKLMDDWAELSMTVPVAATLVKAESLGHRPGAKDNCF